MDTNPFNSLVRALNKKFSVDPNLRSFLIIFALAVGRITVWALNSIGHLLFG